MARQEEPTMSTTQSATASSTTSSTMAPPVAVPAHRRGVAVLLLGAPLVMAVGRLLLVPMDDQAWDETLTDMAAHQERSDLGWVLAIAASGILGVTATVLAHRLFVAGRNRSGPFVALTTALGWVGCAAVGACGLLMGEMAESPDRAAMVQLLEDFNDGAAGWVFLLSVIGAVGYVVGAVAMARAGLVTKGAAVLVGLGGAATLLTMAGPVTVVLVAAALVLTAGHALTLRTFTSEPAGV
jgi:hypothetical protein